MKTNKRGNEEIEDDPKEKTIVRGSLADNGIKYLCADITGESCKTIIEWIIEENIKDRFDRLTLIISSYGGEVYASFALIDAMRGSSIPVDTIGLGYIASAALTIFINGDRRILTKNTYILAHQYSGGNYGKYHELVASRKEEDWLGEKFVDMYVANSRLNREQVKKILMRPSDSFLTALEALKYGLADEIKMTKIGNRK